MVTKAGKATPRKTTTKKTTVKKTTAPKASPVKAETTGFQGVTVAPGQEAMRKKELIDLVVTRSGIKKKFAKPVVEAMLDVLGEAVSSGKELNLQPLGKVMPKKQADKPNATVSVVKIRQSKTVKAASIKPALTTAAE